MLNLNNRSVAFKGLESNFKVEGIPTIDNPEWNETRRQIDLAKNVFLKHRNSDGDTFSIKILPNRDKNDHNPHDANIVCCYDEKYGNVFSSRPFERIDDPSKYITSLTPSCIVSFLQETLEQLYL